MKQYFWVIAVAGLVIGFLAGFYLEPRPAVATVNFNHAKHQRISCVICHSGITTQANATVPSTALCAKCHNTSPDQTSVGLALWQTAEKQPQRWPVSYRLPAHVYFSHRRHVEMANLTCQGCHSDMSEQTATVTMPLKTLNMKQCLACHREKNASTDCAHCHR